jgi:hypothetical protein
MAIAHFETDTNGLPIFRGAVFHPYRWDDCLQPSLFGSLVPCDRGREGRCISESVTQPNQHARGLGQRPRFLLTPSKARGI